MPTTQTKPQRKMVEIDVDETSGVDWPAHLAPGWVVCKSATTQDVQALFGPDATEGNHTMATDTQGTPSVEDLAKQVEALTKSLAEQTDLAKAAQQEAADKQAELDKVAKAAESELTEEQKLIKALPEEMRAKFEAMEKAAEADRAEIQKERDARLDEKAVVEYGKMFKSVSLNSEEVGPQFRQLEIISPELHKSVITALKAADAQLTTAGIFATVGKSGGDAASAEELLKSKAAELRVADPTLTPEGAFAKACNENGDVLKRYYEEQGK